MVHHPQAWWGTRQWLGRVVAPALAAPGGQHRLLTVCSGALLAADAGLLAGRCVTTHHELLDDLARLAPGAQVQANRVFVEDGPLLSSAGIDLALHLIAQTLGEGVASAVAQVMGNLIAAQLYQAARRDLGNLDAQFASGDFLTLVEWLRTRIHRHGFSKTPSELVEAATGHPLSHEALVLHLHERYVLHRA